MRLHVCCCLRLSLSEQEKQRSSSLQVAPLWLLPLWLIASVLIHVKGSHWGNERYSFLRPSVMFLLSYSFFLCHLVFLLVTSLLDNMVGQESDVCRTYTLLFQHFALFRFLRLSMVFPLSYSCFLCHLVFLLLLTSLLDNMVGQEFDVCRTFTLLFQHFALFRFLRLSMVFPLSYSCFLCHLVFLLLLTSLLDNMVGQEFDVCRTFTLLFQHFALFRFLRLSMVFPLSYSCFLCHLVFLLLLTSLLDNMVGQEFDVCRTFTLLFQHFALFRFLRLSMMFPLSYSCRLVFIFSSSLLDNMVIRESDVCRTFTLLFEHSALIVSIRLPVLLPQCPLLLICFLIIALSTSFSINLYNSCISVVFGPVVHLFDISSNNTCLSCMFFVCPIWDI
ncbi:uncharacterized protein LOC134184163 [Corticium candelabrum]|uniref:uncharacterized protein LOC134184163 n=1 Tax=Corticium candelabrum TaxID=121492 RepID=UPI002E308CF7|nr:uncharacterized protein LOC134184163 [Corticium candelabrum]